MKLIIDIPKEEYEEFKKAVTFLQSIGVDFSEMRQYMLAIANGTILEQEPRKGYLSIDDVMSVFDDFMCGEVDEDGTETFLKMLKDKAESGGGE